VTHVTKTASTEFQKPAEEVKVIERRRSAKPAKAKEKG